LIGTIPRTSLVCVRRIRHLMVRERWRTRLHHGGGGHEPHSLGVRRHAAGRRDSKPLAAFDAEPIRNRLQQIVGELDEVGVAASHVYPGAFPLNDLMCFLRHQIRKPPLAKIRPGRPAPMVGPGTATGLLPIPGLTTILKSEGSGTLPSVK
jgi:hypothetical protein